MPPHPDPLAKSFTATEHHDTYPVIANANHKGHTVLITGASKGIGRATALSFARAGASVIIAARSSLDQVEQELRAVISAEQQVLKIKLDVSSEDDVDVAVEQVKQHFSSIDVLVNNAGHLEQYKPVGESNRSEWWKTWEVNVKGLYLVTQSLLPLVLQSSLKTIVNVTSRGALATWPGASGYQISKTAVTRITEFLDLEYKDKGLVAYAVHPGGVVTELAMAMPKEAHVVLKDTPELAADTISWLTLEQRDWLSGRFISSDWDMTELLAKKDEIVEGDKLKLRIVL